jgi:hypothetical protein
LVFLACYVPRMEALEASRPQKVPVFFFGIMEMFCAENGGISTTPRCLVFFVPRQHQIAVWDARVLATPVCFLGRCWQADVLPTSA